ncbi:phage portal protein [Rubinisphaera italica]|uniref:Phage portal protein, lambda family n=1 Tax=Rubinisphaera italica TaxID=2527969 RepID=A0A5C5XKF6_9PLAN|nr:phage portal protein [Rubinisphaera italica]TWT63188.1 Phage portal protein, lambda family [Rubinisphaera italica]
MIATAEQLGCFSGSTELQYAAAEGSTRRQAPPLNLRTEDHVLKTSARKRLISNSRDLRRNFALAGWVIRKHLDYVASFEFQMQTPNKKFNAAVEKLMKRWSKPNCDVSGRFTLRKMLRLLESKAVLDGDAGFMKVAQFRNGKRFPKLQGIEGDRLMNPDKPKDPDRWEKGIKVDSAYRHQAYGIGRRTRNGRLELERVVTASRMVWHNGYVENFDQIRGISPLAPGLNTMRDTYEGFDYALARMKIAQLFAFKITRKMEQLEEEAGGYGLKTATDEDEETGESKKYEVDFGRGPAFLDLDPGDDAAFLESAQPSDQFQSFTMHAIQMSLKALDIPFSFYSEDFTNFFGSRGALMHYERSCSDRRETLQEILRQITIWLLQIWIIDGDLELPKGWTIGDLEFYWNSVGIPWWDPAKEIKGDLMAIKAGLDTPQRICKERGRGDFYENLEELKKAKDAAEDLGLELSFDAPGEAKPKPAKEGEDDADDDEE